MINQDMLSSGALDWETPNDLFRYWDRIFNFTVDVAASLENRKVKRCFIAPTDSHEHEWLPWDEVRVDGLAQDWSDERCWLNPPYGRKVGRWVQKAYEESRKGALVCCLLAARTDTRWWQTYVMKADYIYFIPGRVRFIRGDKRDPAPFPSAIVAFFPQI